jgi:formate hydrogenlyase subunit 4
MILYGAAVKLFVLGAVVVRIVAPLPSGDTWLDWLVFGFEMVLLAVVVGIVESTMARLRLVNIPKVLVGACLLSAFGLILLLR